MSRRLDFGCVWITATSRWWGTTSPSWRPAPAGSFAHAGRGRVDDTLRRDRGISVVDKWRKWLEMITVYEEVKARPAVKYTRKDFAGTMQGHEFEFMLADVGSHGALRAGGGAGGWYAASIPGAGTTPLRPKTSRRDNLADHRPLH
jgi:hypothetical protein